MGDSPPTVVTCTVLSDNVAITIKGDDEHPGFGGPYTISELYAHIVIPHGVGVLPLRRFLRPPDLVAVVKEKSGVYHVKLRGFVADDQVLETHIQCSDLHVHPRAEYHLYCDRTNVYISQIKPEVTGSAGQT